MPALSWCQIWLPVAVRPAADPRSTLTAPAFAIAPTSSPRAPIARSSKPSLLKSPTARASPKRSPVSATLSMPALSWCQNWLPVAVRPAADPRSTLTAPALATVPTSSPGAPTARSSKPSLSKSPTAKALPNASPLSATLATPALSWCQIWSPVAVRPARRPAQHVDRAGVRDRPDVLAAHADRQVVEAVVVEVAAGQGAGEAVIQLRGALDAGDILVPELVARGGEAGGRPAEHVGRAGARDRADAFAAHAEYQVVEAVVVEIAHLVSSVHVPL